MRSPTDCPTARICAPWSCDRTDRSYGTVANGEAAPAQNRDFVDVKITPSHVAPPAGPVIPPIAEGAACDSESHTDTGLQRSGGRYRDSLDAWNGCKPFLAELHGRGDRGGAFESGTVQSALHGQDVMSVKAGSHFLSAMKLRMSRPAPVSRTKATAISRNNDEPVRPILAARTGTGTAFFQGGLEIYARSVKCSGCG